MENELENTEMQSFVMVLPDGSLYDANADHILTARMGAPCDRFVYWLLTAVALRTKDVLIKSYLTSVAGRYQWLIMGHPVSENEWQRMRHNGGMLALEITNDADITALSIGICASRANPMQDTGFTICASRYFSVLDRVPPHEVLYGFHRKYREIEGE